jgi:hypothetical protein
MADKNWGIKIFCECGVKYYSMNNKNKISCPTCSAAYVPEDLNLKSPVVLPKPEPKKVDELANIDDSSDDSSDDDVISLDDQKEIEDSNEEVKID